MGSEKIDDTIMDRLGGCVTEGSGPKPPTQGTMARTMPVSRTGKGTNGETSWLRSRVLNLVTLIALAQVIPTVRGGDISCQGMRYVYFNKVLSPPNSPGLSHHLASWPTVDIDLVDNFSDQWTLGAS